MYSFSWPKHVVFSCRRIFWAFEWKRSKKMRAKWATTRRWQRKERAGWTVKGEIWRKIKQAILWGSMSDRSARFCATGVIWPIQRDASLFREAEAEDSAEPKCFIVVPDISSEWANRDSANVPLMGGAVKYVTFSCQRKNEREWWNMCANKPAHDNRGKWEWQKSCIDSWTVPVLVTCK